MWECQNAIKKINYTYFLGQWREGEESFHKCRWYCLHNLVTNYSSWANRLSTSVAMSSKMTPDTWNTNFISVQFSCSDLSYSLQPCGLQHARLPCPSPTPRAYSNSCPLNWWCIKARRHWNSPIDSCRWLGLKCLPVEMIWGIYFGVGIHRL